jgi:hypothetical protein
MKIVGVGTTALLHPRLPTRKIRKPPFLRFRNGYMQRT